MTIAILILYGILQGLTEFLPVSSSAHLALIPFFFKSNDPGVAFDLAMHVGTALAVVVYFYRQVFHLAKDSFYLVTLQKDKCKNLYYVSNFFIATVVTVIFALIFKHLAATWGRNPLFMSFNLIAFGLFMYLADRMGKSDESAHMGAEFDLKKSFLIGLFQGLAIFPGVSRSGATISISRGLGMSREESTRFSFLLGLPIIFGGFILKLRELNESVSILDIVVGIVISFVVGLITIHFFLKFISRIGLAPFFFYRLILAIVILVMLYY